MPHIRSTCLVALLALGTATMIVPLEAWAKEAKKGARSKAGKAARKAAKKAKRMEKVGKVAYRKGRFDDALIAFKAAYEARPQPKFLYNIARCHEKRGDLAKAADHYERYLREAPDAEDRDAVETQAEFLTQKLKATMGRLAVVSVPSGAGLRVQGEGEKIDVTTPWSGWLSPGRYELSVLLKGHAEHTERVALAAGQEQEVVARLEAEDAKEEVLVAVAEEPEPPPRSGRTEPRPAELAAEAAKAEPGPAAPEARPAEPAAPKPEPAAESKPKKVVPPPPQGPKEEGMGVVPLAAFGLGAAALVSWGVFGALALADGGEFDEGMETPRTSGKGRKEMEALAEEVNLFGAVANVSLAVAAAAGLTGGAILLVSGDGSEAAAGVTWRW